MKKTKLLALAGMFSLAAFSAPGYAVNGHYVAGIEGTKGPSVPPEGFYYRGYLVHYDLESLQSDTGNMDIDGSVTAFANRFIWVTDKQFLGADYGAEAIIIAQHNDFDFANTSETGIGDIFIGPVILAWHGKQWDTWSQPILSKAAMHTSSGALPAPAPMPERLASMRSQPSSTATMELATPSARLWWAWMPVSVSGFRTSLSARKRSRMSFMFMAPPESTT